MRKSQSLRRADLRRAFRIVGDCRDVGHDLAAWVHRAMDGLRLASNSVMVCAGYGPDDRYAKGVLEGRRLWDLGWQDDRERLAWLALLDGGRAFDHQTHVRLFATPGRLVVRSRRRLVPDREWYSGAERNEDRRGVGQDDTLVALYRPRGTSFLAFSLNRAWGERSFEDRDRRFLRLVCEELDALPEAVLVRDGQGPLGRLSPRAREVLLALVEGDGEKQVALRLGLSRHTVHDLVKDLYRRFGVASRGELLAAYYRRRLPTDGPA